MSRALRHLADFNPAPKSSDESVVEVSPRRARTRGLPQQAKPSGDHQEGEASSSKSKKRKLARLMKHAQKSAFACLKTYRFTYRLSWHRVCFVDLQGRCLLVLPIQALCRRVRVVEMTILLMMRPLLWHRSLRARAKAMTLQLQQPW